MNATVRRRARHVITENHRVLQAREAMQRSDARLLGQLMNASHISLRDDFEVSSIALNRMVDLAQAHPACYGARMTGAGFGGCAVALVDADADGLEHFIRIIGEGYRARMNQLPNIYICQAAAGAALIRFPNT